MSASRSMIGIAQSSPSLTPEEPLGRGLPRTSGRLIAWCEAMEPPESDVWSFYKHERRGWSWQIHGAGARHSAHCFIGIVEAYADAVNHGYRPGVSTMTMETCRRSRWR
jgi:hypothetical protein